MIYIIGYGAMAKAIIKGFVKQNIKCAVVGRNKEKLETIHHKFSIPVFLLENFNISQKTILLAIKPYALKEVASSMKGEANICYSILAATPIKELKKYIKARYYIRAMPNIAAAKQSSMTTLTGDEEIKNKALQLFTSIGKTLWVENETKLDIATIITGSGPAFLALIAEALTDGAVASGLTRSQAFELTMGLFESFTALNTQHPTHIKEAVMSPKGVTACGIQLLEQRAIRSAFFDVVNFCAKKIENEQR